MASTGQLALTEPSANLAPTAQWKCQLADLLICFCLISITVAVYAPVRHHQFVYFDDKEYVTENPFLQQGLTAAGIVWSFAHPYAGNWHPLTWISHMIDCQLWGLNPKAHHLTNVAFHTANVTLLFLVLLAMTGVRWCSALVAALFAWHPLHVESVAWVSERKDVLSAFFWLLTMAAYLAYIRQPRWPRYMLMLLAFALGLLAKPMLVTLPFALLLLDYWPLYRFQPRSWHSFWPALRPRLTEKLPLFFMAACSSAATFVVQKHAGALGSLQQIGLASRVANALLSYVAYARKMFWPVDLAVFYPFRIDVSAGQFVAAASLLLTVTIVTLLVARRHPFVPVGWFWYLGTLLPVIGLVQTGGQAMADRYTYLPLIGLFLIGARSIRPILSCEGPRRMAVILAVCVVLAGCLIETHFQLSYWKDNQSLFERALAVTSGNAFAHLNLAESLRDEGDLAGASNHQTEALRLKPDYKEAHYNLASVFLLQNRVEEAIAHLEEALRLDPDYAIAHSNLAEALLRQNKIESAIDHCETALRLAPNLPEALNNLAWIRATQPDPKYRDGKQALRLAERAVANTGGKRADILDTLAAALAENGRFDEAVQTAEQARSLALVSKNNQVATALSEHIVLFRSRQPLRMPPP